MGCRYIINTNANDDQEVLSNVRENNEGQTLVPTVDIDNSKKIRYRSNDSKIKRLTRKETMNSIPYDLRKYQTQNQHEAHSASTYLITCMDFRLIDDVAHCMNEMGYHNNYDQFIVAGASLGLVQSKFQHWGQSVLDHMEIGLELHKFRKIIIIDHKDCGAFKKIMPYKNQEEELANHKACLQQSYNMLKQRFPDFKLEAYLMDLFGNIEEIAIDTTQSSFDQKAVDMTRSDLLSHIVN